MTAWSDPPTKADLEHLSAEEWNQFVRDNLVNLNERVGDAAWANFVPEITQVGVITTSSLASRSIRRGGGSAFCWVYAVISGTGSSGTPARVTLPYDHAGAGATVGPAWLYDSSAGLPYPGLARTIGTDQVEFFTEDGAQPWGEAPAIGLDAGDYIMFSAEYEMDA